MPDDAVQLDMFRDVHHQLGFLIAVETIQPEPLETMEAYTVRLAGLYQASAVQYAADLGGILDSYQENTP